MSSDPYSAEVRALFAAPEHGGVLDDASCAAVEDQGVRMSLFATVEEGIVTGLRFQAWGCPHVIATAEAFCAGPVSVRSAADNTARQAAGRPASVISLRGLGGLAGVLGLA